MIFWLLNKQKIYIILFYAGWENGYRSLLNTKRIVLFTQFSMFSICLNFCTLSSILFVEPLENRCSGAFANMLGKYLVRTAFINGVWSKLRVLSNDLRSFFFSAFTVYFSLFILNFARSALSDRKRNARIRKLFQRSIIEQMNEKNLEERCVWWERGNLWLKVFPFFSPVFPHPQFIRPFSCLRLQAPPTTSCPSE